MLRVTSTSISTANVSHTWNIAEIRVRQKSDVCCQLLGPCSCSTYAYRGCAKELLVAQRYTFSFIRIGGVHERCHVELVGALMLNVT
eukprot:8887488-Ditylum_brightwellii.AAC.1